MNSWNFLKIQNSRLVDEQNIFQFSLIFYISFRLFGKKSLRKNEKQCSDYSICLQRLGSQKKILQSSKRSCGSTSCVQVRNPNFIRILSKFYPNFIQILSKSYPNLIQILSKSYQNLILFSAEFYPDEIWMKWAFSESFCKDLDRILIKWVLVNKPV